MTNRDEEGVMENRYGSTDEYDCGSVRDRLPMKLLGVLSAEDSGRVELHLQAWSDCAEEEAFLDHLRMARAEPPAELRGRIVAALDQGSHRWRKMWSWGVPAIAAALALALGLGNVMDRARAREEIWSLALQPGSTTDWIGDDWMVAGAPLLQSLPDEVLRQVLEELSQ
jgi:hypothetical protein